MDLEKMGYSIRELGAEEFSGLWKKHAQKFFDESQLIFRPYDLLSESEKEKAEGLRKRLGDPFKIRLGLYHHEQFVGWSWGFQESAETFYMCNSAVFPEHRRKGLYTALMKEIVKRATQEGFQKIYSRHNATNNAVIIPKLKACFNITHLEVSDNFGVLVYLTLFPNPLRKKVLEFRVGELKPDPQLKTLLGIP